MRLLERYAAAAEAQAAHDRIEAGCTCRLRKDAGKTTPVHKAVGAANAERNAAEDEREHENAVRDYKQITLRNRLADSDVSRAELEVYETTEIAHLTGHLVADVRVHWIVVIRRNNLRRRFH